MRVRSLAPVAAVLALALASAGCRAAADPAPEPPPERLGLMTTLPVYWPEAHGVGELLQGGGKPSQARQVLETRFELEPLDTLETGALRGYSRLMLAQPRALSPSENVALDSWVREGGRLLLFADPMLTSHSHFAIGDKRRGQDVILLSPILDHWGLTLSYDPGQPSAERTVNAAGVAVPVALAGKLGVSPGGKCEIAGEGILARCPIGRGRVAILADAAVLDEAADGNPLPREEAILGLARLAFD